MTFLKLKFIGKYWKIAAVMNSPNCCDWKPSYRLADRAEERSSRL